MRMEMVAMDKIHIQNVFNNNMESHCKIVDNIEDVFIRKLSAKNLIAVVILSSLTTLANTNVIQTKFKYYVGRHGDDFHSICNCFHSICNCFHDGPNAMELTITLMIFHKVSKKRMHALQSRTNCPS